MTEVLQITQRHYEIIVRQALENLPCESGGFLGGQDDFIKGILPVYNQCYGDSTETFIVTNEDVTRAHAFFQKHKLKYYGLYHSHPRGLPEPSHQDLQNPQRYHFIIGLRNPENPEFNAFIVEGKKAIQVPLKVIDDKGITVVDLHGKQSNLSEAGFVEEAARLASFYEDIKHERAMYPKMAPSDPFKDSSFSTLA